mmetsp:Transcript_24503/g.57919  ORF Transcript_24503/g.57919 Transcript_24503/m.57919 type:complete len:480 (+) Transcript_24503:180-1619(+)
MVPKSLDLSHEFSDYVPEDKDQRIVKTPYGRGIVIRTRKGNDSHAVDKDEIRMKEIKLMDWTKRPENDRSTLYDSSKDVHMLYSPAEFPSVSPVVGSEVLTKWGRGKVTEIRDDCMKTHVVKLSSWRLAGRSSVFCYVSAKECEVLRLKKIYDMDVFEKIEHANELKQQATLKFRKKNYTGALELFAKAVDVVRYVQHKSDSTNEVRADLVAMMITCSNNAALCSSKKDDWDRAARFGTNALVLIEALEEKGEGSKIKKVLNDDGIRDSQLFGTWKVKSLLLIAKSQMEQHNASKMSDALKKALKAISRYKKEGDLMYKQLATQEKDIRRLRLEFSKKNKATRVKEKERAKAMFCNDKEVGKNSKKKDPAIQSTISIHESDPSSSSSYSVQSIPQYSPKETEKPSGMVVTKQDENYSTKSETQEIQTPPKNSSATFGGDEDEDDDDSPISFVEEHIEALLIVGGIAIGWLAVKMLTKRR